MTTLTHLTANPQKYNDPNSSSPTTFYTEGSATYMPYINPKEKFGIERIGSIAVRLNESTGAQTLQPSRLLTEGSESYTRRPRGFDIPIYYTPSTKPNRYIQIRYPVPEGAPEGTKGELLFSLKMPTDGEIRKQLIENGMDEKAANEAILEDLPVKVLCFEKTDDDGNTKLNFRVKWIRPQVERGEGKPDKLAADGATGKKGGVTPAVADALNRLLNRKNKFLAGTDYLTMNAIDSLKQYVPGPNSDSIQEQNAKSVPSRVSAFTQHPAADLRSLKVSQPESPISSPAPSLLLSKSSANPLGQLKTTSRHNTPHDQADDRTNFDPHFIQQFFPTPGVKDSNYDYEGVEEFYSEDDKSPSQPFVGGKKDAFIAADDFIPIDFEEREGSNIIISVENEPDETSPTGTPTGIDEEIRYLSEALNSISKRLQNDELNKQDKQELVLYGGDLLQEFQDSSVYRSVLKSDEAEYYQSLYNSLVSSFNETVAVFRGEADNVGIYSSAAENTDFLTLRHEILSAPLVITEIGGDGDSESSKPRSYGSGAISQSDEEPEKEKKLLDEVTTQYAGLKDQVKGLKESKATSQNWFTRKFSKNEALNKFEERLEDARNKLSKNPGQEGIKEVVKDLENIGEDINAYQSQKNLN